MTGFDEPDDAEEIAALGRALHSSYFQDEEFRKRIRPINTHFETRAKKSLRGLSKDDYLRQVRKTWVFAGAFNTFAVSAYHAGKVGWGKNQITDDFQMHWQAGSKFGALIRRRKKPEQVAVSEQVATDEAVETEEFEFCFSTEKQLAMFKEMTFVICGDARF